MGVKPEVGCIGEDPLNASDRSQLAWNLQPTDLMMHANSLVHGAGNLVV